MLSKTFVVTRMLFIRPAMAFGTK